MAAALLVVSVKIAGIFFLSKEARDLQTAISNASDWQTDSRIQFSVGPGILSIGRLAALCIDDIPREAHQAISAVRSASVGVYQLDRSSSGMDRARLLAAADRRLEARGWERIVAVSENQELVMIYMPQSWDENEPLEVCIAVCSENELVVVSAEADPAPLMKLVQQHLPKHRLI